MTVPKLLIIRRMNDPQAHDIQVILDEVVKIACRDTRGDVASYIPELALVNPEITAISVALPDGQVFSAGNGDTEFLTLQSVAKLVILIGLLEELGPEKVYEWVKVEPSGAEFASLARLDQFGPMPSNPLLNAGAIALCSHIPGAAEQQLAWLEKWIERLFGEKLNLNPTVFASERRTGDRNRSIAYLLKSTGLISGEVKDTLESYFALCSYEANVRQVAYMGMLLANHGRDLLGEQVISEPTVRQVVSIMATCGLYNETGTHMVRCGLPAKSAVSGFIVATAPRIAGIAVVSPRVNRKGNSIRGGIMLEHLANKLNWHFAI